MTMGQLLRLRDITSCLDAGEQVTLAVIANRLHCQQGYVRRGLVELVVRGAIIRVEEQGDVPLYSLSGKKLRLGDAIVPAPGAARKTKGKSPAATDGQKVLSGCYAKPVDPIVLPPRPLAKVRRDEHHIVSLRTAAFGIAFDIGKALVERGGLTAGEAYKVCAIGLREPAAMCDSRADLAIQRRAASVTG